jgi:hypothetical protein
MSTAVPLEDAFRTALDVDARAQFGGRRQLRANSLASASISVRRNQYAVIDASGGVVSKQFR